MSSKARQYTAKTLKQLFALSGNQCAYPGCLKAMVNKRNAKDSNICHIAAANEGGERYDPSMSDEQRADYQNLVLLCIQHHDETDDVNLYTVAVLQQMKQDHESDIVNKTLSKKPSMLVNAISAIANMDLEDIPLTVDLDAFDINAKISHNCIKKNQALIQEYKIYHHKINALYDELESQGSLKKESLLHNIRIIYTLVKGSYVLDSANSLAIIRRHSDNIIDDVYDRLYAKLENSSDWEEDIILGIRLIMTDAFMRCKILEELPKNDS